MADAITADGLSSEPGKFKQGAKIAGWSFVFLFFLAIFTIVKLPEERIRAYVNGMIASALAPQGIGFNSEEAYTSVGFGLSYVMKQVTLTFPSPAEPVKLDRVVVSPSLIAMVFGKIGGNFNVEQADSEIQGSFAMKGSDAHIDLTLENVDLGKMGVLAAAARIRGGGIVNGKANLAGNLNTPSTLVGDIQLKVSKLTLEPQSIMGLFKISQRLNVSESEFLISVDKARASIRTARLGKEGTSDDIRANATGEVTLGRDWNSSNLNLKTTFRYSEIIGKDNFLVDAILKNGKQADGSYSYSFTGPIHSVVANPPIGGG